MHFPRIRSGFAKFQGFGAFFPVFPLNEERGHSARGSSQEGICLKNIQTGARKRGLSPKSSEKIGGKSFWKVGPFRGKLGPFQADWDQFLRTPQPRGKSRNSPARALFGPIGAFRAKPPFAKPPFGFPRFLPSEVIFISEVVLKDPAKYPLKQA